MPDTYISVDIEASGPVPGEFSMLSLGACVVGATEKNFYVELKPITLNFKPESLAIAGLDLDHLSRAGTPPPEAMHAFDEWLREVTPRDRRRFKRLLEDAKNYESIPIRTRLTDEELAKFAAAKFASSSSVRRVRIGIDS